MTLNFAEGNKEKAANTGLHLTENKLCLNFDGL